MDAVPAAGTATHSGPVAVRNCWCHSCSCHVEASVSHDGELVCNSCEGEFVERLPQASLSPPPMRAPEPRRVAREIGRTPCRERVPGLHTRVSRQGRRCGWVQSHGTTSAWAFLRGKRAANGALRLFYAQGHGESKATASEATTVSADGTIPHDTEHGDDSGGDAAQVAPLPEFGSLLEAVSGAFEQATLDARRTQQQGQASAVRPVPLRTLRVLAHRYVARTRGQHRVRRAVCKVLWARCLVSPLQA